MAETPRGRETASERIAQCPIGLSFIGTALNYVRNGLAMQQPVGQESRDDWIRFLDRGREKLARLERPRG